MSLAIGSNPVRGTDSTLSVPRTREPNAPVQPDKLKVYVNLSDIPNSALQGKKVFIVELGVYANVSNRIYRYAVADAAPPLDTRVDEPFVVESSYQGQMNFEMGVARAVEVHPRVQEKIRQMEARAEQNSARNSVVFPIGSAVQKLFEADSMGGDKDGVLEEGEVDVNGIENTVMMMAVNDHFQQQFSFFFSALSDGRSPSEGEHRGVIRIESGDYVIEIPGLYAPNGPVVSHRKGGNPEDVLTHIADVGQVKAVYVFQDGTEQTSRVIDLDMVFSMPPGYSQSSFTYRQILNHAIANLRIISGPLK